MDSQCGVQTLKYGAFFCVALVFGLANLERNRKSGWKHSLAHRQKVVDLAAFEEPVSIGPHLSVGISVQDPQHVRP